MTCKSLVRLLLLALALSAVTAYADFPAPTLYRAKFNVGFCVTPPGWSQCIETPSKLQACYITGEGGNWENIRVSDTPNPVGDYECIAKIPGFCSPECFTGTSASPVHPCPPGSTLQQNGQCSCNGNLQQANNSCTGGKDNGKPCPFCGNPVNPANGNKIEEQVVYRGLSGFGLSLTYNVFDDVTGRFGRRWRDSFDRRISQDGANVFVYRPDGKAFRFVPNSGAWVGDADANDRLVELQNPPGTRTGWQLSVADGDQLETYDAAGQLLSIQSRSGLTQTLTYSDGTGGANGGFILDANGNPTTTVLPAGLLIRIAEHFGRTLSFGYDALLHVVKVTDPAVQTYRISYLHYLELSSITFPDTKVRSYLYNESANTGGANLPLALTGIVDENGARYATFKYDAQERATSTEHAGAVSRYTLLYDTGTTTVTDPLGTARSYAFSSVLGAFKNTGITGGACPSCGSASQTFDANGNAASRTDWNGNRTNYTYDLTRNLETSRTEALTSSGGTTPQTRTITTEWDANFRLPKRIAEPLRITTNTYDADGTTCGARGTLCSKTIQATNDTNGSQGFSATPVGTPRTWTYTYNANGSVLTVDGPRADSADVTTYTYYSNTDADPGKRGNVATISNALSHLTSFTSYNAHGQPLTIVDANGTTTTLTYNERQWLETRTIGGELTSYDYDGAGNLTKVTPPDGSFLSYTYDDAHRLTSISDNLGNRIGYTLDAMGNRTLDEVRDPQNQLAQTRSRVYSNLNRLFQELGAQSQTTEYGYDNQGNVTSVKDPLNHTTVNQYDALNRLKQVTDPGLGVTQYAYNGLDALVQVTDPRTLVTGYTVDGLGNLTQQSSPDTGSTINTYDAAGNLITQTDAKSQLTTYAYDALNRVTLIAFHDGSKQTYAYDATAASAVGRLWKITETDPLSQATSVIEYAYDPLGRVTTDKRNVGALQFITSYHYDASGRLDQITYPSGRTANYTFDSLGRIESITTTKPGDQQQTVVSSVNYHPFGGVKGYTLGNGRVYTRGIDLDGRIASYSLGAQSFAIGYDAASRIEFVSEAGNPPNTDNYGYDAVDRLTSASTPTTGYAYTYDAVGNRSTRTAGSSTDTYAYSPMSNRISSVTPTSGPVRNFVFDSNGSTTADGINTYGYDVRGRMVQATSAIGTTTYQVNALGQRVRKMSNLGDSLFHYDMKGHLIAETNSLGVPKREVIYLGDIPIGVVQ